MIFVRLIFYLLKSVLHRLMTKEYFMMKTLLVLLSLLSCGKSGEKAVDRPADTVRQAEPFHFPYDLNKPDDTFKLPNELDEISGLGISPAGDRLAAVQDEDGKLFFIDPLSGEVTAEIDFWKDGDYEGIEMVGDEVYVVKSTGTVYRVKDPGEEGQEVEKYNYFLDDKNDVEGLAYDPAGHRLLLACKAEAGAGEEYELKKAIYAFDLNTFTLQEKPVYLISLADVQDYLDTAPAIRKLEKLMDFFQPGESEFSFSPSGIAIHPVTGHIYIPSSVGKLLLILSPDGRVLHIEKLSKEVHAQPEGICFAADGALFISNEGKNGKAKIHRFSYRP